MKNDDFAPVTLKKMGKLGDFSRKKGDFMEVQISPKWEKKGTVLTLNIWGKLRVSPFHPEKMVIWRAKIVILTQQTWWFHRLNHGDPPNMVLWKVLVEYSWGFWGYMTNGYMWEVRWKMAALNQQNVCRSLPWAHEPYPDMANLHPGQVPKQSSPKNHDQSWLVGGVDHLEKYESMGRITLWQTVT